MATGHSTPTVTESEMARLATARAELPAVVAGGYLNTGSKGPLSRRSRDTLVAMVNDELERGRIGAAPTTAAFAGTRLSLARLLGCDPDEVALTHNATEGLNIALWGLDWQPGDELVCATIDRPYIAPAYILHQRRGVQLRATRIGDPGLDPVAELRKVLTPRTRAVLLSHVAWTTGMVLPVRDLAAAAHEVGALLICDGAQSCGMVPTPVYALGVDAYACAGQKWLLGPDGTGALFVRREHLGAIAQTYMGAGSVAGPATAGGDFAPPPTAARYEAATLHPPSVAALGASIDWLADEIGLSLIHARIASLGRYCHDALAAISGVALVTPRDRMAGLVHFTLAGVAPPDLTSAMATQGIQIRHTLDPQANRISTGWYNTEEEIDRAVAAIAALGRRRS
jgi:L-cysteine/cystine lyase